jgi:8-oxo-dGTP diphosphatase
MDKRPRVGLGVLIFKDHKVLFGQRLSPHGEGMWCPPGGHLEFGESFEDCAQREVAEECGLTVYHLAIVGCTNDIHENEGKHYVTIMMRADWVSGEPQVLEPHKMVKWQWFDWDNLPAPLFLSIENLIKTGFRPY